MFRKKILEVTTEIGTQGFQRVEGNILLTVLDTVDRCVVDSRYVLEPVLAHLAS